MVSSLTNNRSQNTASPVRPRYLSRALIWLLSTIGRIPPNVRSRLGRAVGFLISLVPSKDRTVAVRQMAHFLDQKVPPVSAVYQSVAQSAAEMFNFDPYLVSAERYIEFGDDPIFAEVIRRKKGVVALTAHFGNWELLGAYFVSKRGLPVCTAARKARSAIVQPALEWLRAKYGIQTAWRDERGAVRQIVETLKKGGVVASVVDQDTDVESEQSLFFGVSAKTPSSLVKLALRLDVPIVTVFSVRSGLNHYRITLTEVTDRSSVHSVLSEFHRELEMRIRENPEQWAWFHKRWRTRDSGDRLSTKRYLEWLNQS